MKAKKFLNTKRKGTPHLKFNVEGSHPKFYYTSKSRIGLALTPTHTKSGYTGMGVARSRWSPTFLVVATGVITYDVAT